MRTRIVTFVCLGILVGLLSRPGRASIVAAKDRANDKRLETRVTISAPSIDLGQLLEKLSIQTGVNLSAQEDEPGSGIRLCVFLRNVPLGDAMNAVWSLLSYRKADWDWDWHDAPDKRRYVLVQSRESKNLAALLRSEVQTAYEDEAATLLSTLNMTDKERKQLAKDHPELADMIIDPDTRVGLSVLVDAFPGDAYRKVLRTDQPIVVPAENLSAASKATLISMYGDAKSSSMDANGVVTVSGPPKNFDFFTQTAHGICQ